MDKSAIVLYHQHHSKINNYEPIRVNNKIIPFKSKTSILGVEFDKKLTLTNHITFRYNIALNTLQKLNTNLQFHFFQMLSQSQLFFSPTALIYPPKIELKKAQILQNKAIHQINKIHCVNKDLHTEFNIIPTTEKLHNRFCRVHYKLANQNNYILEKLLRQSQRDTKFTILLVNPPDCILGQYYSYF